ncbi:L,D-transpeptidase family protein [uncultured Photobacterium sp.]|uniref:L,D-transpeptidase family protein n=1 Tax=uncultured Photobacterium sp. TaxID=173973 RepID=UPI002608B8B2|nr:L,D-transpeptidase family protein [uncultured Photobacterium sp.]
MIDIVRVINKSCKRLLYLLAVFPVISVAEPRLGWQALNDYEPRSQRQLCSYSSNKVCFSNELEKIYQSNDFSPIWSDESLRNELILQLKSLAYAELVPGLELRLVELDWLSKKKDQRGFDLLATDSLLVYKAIIQQVQERPSRLFKNHKLHIPQQSYLDFKQLISPQNLHDELLSLRPKVKRLENSIAVADKFKQLPPHSFSLVSRKQVIRRNQEIANGHALLDVLFQYGDLARGDYEWLRQQPVIENSGAVNVAIKDFQRRNGLSVDGSIGPTTAAQLALPYTEVARVIALNLQRSRFGSNGGKRPVIQVNIPDYMLKITRQDQLLFESKVIVGRASRPTNLFSSSLNTMVVNPTWNIPMTIKQKDVIPKVKKSPKYLAQKNMKIVKSWVDRSEILPEQIEWSMVNPKTFPYEFQQGPGPSNALGRVKFLMPNDYAIYLHDTPARSLFSRNKRNLSSGCVRVERAEELAKFILAYQRRSSQEAFDKMVLDEEPDTVSLARRMDVEFMYLTAWVDENDQLQLREDIYGYDRPGKKPVKSEFVTLKDFRY